MEQTDDSHDVQSGWLESRGCRMNGLMEQTVVTMCNLYSSTVAAGKLKADCMRQLYLHYG